MHRPARQLLQQHPVSLAPVALARVHRHDAAAHLAGDDDIRREQLRFIIEHKASLAAVYALYQRLPGDTYLFNGDSDVVYYRTVAEALEETYPESPYLQSLLAEIAQVSFP